MNDTPKDVTVNITYRFTTGETQEITADILVKQARMTLEQAITLCEVLNGMNDTEANQERRETRRYTSLSRRKPERLQMTRWQICCSLITWCNTYPLQKQGALR